MNPHPQDFAKHCCSRVRVPMREWAPAPGSMSPWGSGELLELRAPRVLQLPPHGAQGLKEQTGGGVAAPPSVHDPGWQ